MKFQLHIRIYEHFQSLKVPLEKFEACLEQDPFAVGCYLISPFENYLSYFASKAM